MASEVAYINKNMLKWARSETPFADAPEVIASRLNISIERFLSWEDEASDEYPSLARAKEIATEIRNARNNHGICWVQVYKNGKYNGEYAIIK